MATIENDLALSPSIASEALRVRRRQELKPVVEHAARTVLSVFHKSDYDQETRWAPTPDDDAIVTTVSGNRVSLLDPQPDTIDIFDIAHSLSMLCRFNGHITMFYSV